MPANDPGQKELLFGLKSSVANLGPALIESKMAQQKVLSEAAAAGGPSSVQEALMNLLDYSKIGMRELSIAVKVPRKKLLSMIQGRDHMSAEILSSIHDVIERKRPGMMERLRKSV